MEEQRRGEVRRQAGLGRARGRMGKGSENLEQPQLCWRGGGTRSKGGKWNR